MKIQKRGKAFGPLGGANTPQNIRHIENIKFAMFPAVSALGIAAITMWVKEVVNMRNSQRKSHMRAPLIVTASVGSAFWSYVSRTSTEMNGAGPYLVVPNGIVPSTENEGSHENCIRELGNLSMESQFSCREVQRRLTMLDNTVRTRLVSNSRWDDGIRTKAGPFISPRRAFSYLIQRSEEIMKMRPRFDLRQRTSE